MHIWLITHSEELKKANGTGQLIRQHLAHMSSLIVWQRKQPAPEILALATRETYLIYPEQASSAAANTQAEIPPAPEHIIILDGTWQQARKMYNQSPYLRQFKHLQIKGQTSSYQRRRNQQKEGLCTAESAAYLLRMFNLHNESTILEEAFLNFNQQLP